MKPQSQLQLSTVILMSVVVLLGYILFVVSNEQAQLVGQEKLAEELVREITDHHVLVAEYIVFQDERTKSQFALVHQTLTQFLAVNISQFDSPEEQAIVNNIKKIHSDFEQIFNLVDQQLQTSSLKSPASQQLVAQLFEKSELLVSYTFELTAVIVARFQQALQQRNLFTGVAIVMLIIIIGLQSRLVLREEISVTETISEMIQKPRMKI